MCDYAATGGFKNWERRSNAASHPGPAAASPVPLAPVRHKRRPHKLTGENRCRRLMCHVLPVLLVLALAGAGITIWQTVGKQQQPTAAAVAATAGQPMTFSVNVKLPQEAVGSACSDLFYQGSSRNSSSGSGGNSSRGGSVVSDDCCFP